MIARDVDDQAQSLANYMPGGKLFAAKNVQSSNFRKLLRGLAGELFTADGFLKTYSDEIKPNNTVLFLSEWELALAIPDGCFKGTGTLNERRRDILVKLASLGIQTSDDFVALALLFGLVVTVNPGITGKVPTIFPMTFPLVLDGDLRVFRFTIIVTFTESDVSRFPLVFPIVFGTAGIAVLECLFSRLKPANCALIFEQI